MTRPDKVDAVIVGAGAAGCLYAARLAEAGRSVVVLECGPPWGLDQLISSQIHARRLKWGGPPVEYADQRSRFPHNLNTGWGFGGAALHHYATWPRMPADAFRLRSLHGRGLDWPFAYETLRPWYDRVQAEVGISGDAAAEPWRPPGAPYPMPGLRTFGQGRILAAGFERLGLAVAPLPAAITTQWYRNRPPCQYDGWCDAGCPILSLANPHANHFPRAQSAGAEFRPWSTVLRLLPAGPEAVSGVEYADEHGRRIVQPADVVILAASVVQNPRILLNSRSPAWPDGAGNRSGQVGRYFMLDSVALAYGLYAQETENHMGVSAGQLMHRRLHDERPLLPFGSYQWQIGPALKPNDIFGIAVSRLDLIGAHLHDFIRRASKHLASQVAMIEQLADGDNRIGLGTGRDRFGMPLPKVAHRFDENSLALWRHCVEEGLAVHRAARAEEVWSAPMISGHMAGGTIMGSDPSSSVCDGYGRAHELRNVIVAGSGLFPATGGASPTFTLMAVAERSAAQLVENWGSYVA